jgi:hypothetical protein
VVSSLEVSDFQERARGEAWSALQAFIAVTTWATWFLASNHNWTAPYTTPYIVATALFANRVGMSAGLWCALFGSLSFNFFISTGCGQCSVVAPWGFNFPTKYEATSCVFMFILAIALAKGEAEKISFVASRRPLPDGPLPFVGKQANGHAHFWDVRRSDDCASDGEVGREYGRILVDRICRGESVPPLAWIIADMHGLEKERCMEIGFLYELEKAIRESLPR